MIGERNSFAGLAKQFGARNKLRTQLDNQPRNLSKLLRRGNDRQRRRAGTGHPISDCEDELQFVGTCQMKGGSLVWHLFELI